MSPPLRLAGAVSRWTKDTALLNCTCSRLTAFSSSPVSTSHRVNNQGRQARTFSQSAAVWSGHSKWASIKHDKGKADAAKSKARLRLTRDITNAVKLGGTNPTTNPRLALAMTTAKKSAVPKASIEAAVARGLGLSASGAALESVTLEAILPPSIAAVIECQTDNKLRLLADLRLIIKEAGGVVSPIGYMFEKKGRIILPQKEGFGMEEVLEPALEAGVLDILEDEQGRVVLYTEPAETTTAAESLTKGFGLEIEETEIIWDPNEDTMVTLDNETAANDLIKFFEKLEELLGFQAIYLNWSKGKIPDDLWAELQSKAGV